MILSENWPTGCEYYLCLRDRATAAEKHRWKHSGDGHSCCSRKNNSPRKFLPDKSKQLHYVMQTGQVNVTSPSENDSGQIYTEAPYELGRTNRARKVIVFALSIVFLNSIFWVSWGLSTGSRVVVMVEGIFLMTSLTLLLVRNRYSFIHLCHAAFWLAFVMVSVGLLGFEGTRQSDNSVDQWWFLVLSISTWFLLRRSSSQASRVYVLICFAAFVTAEFSLVPVPPIWPQPVEHHIVAQSISSVIIFLSVLAISAVYLSEISEAEGHLIDANNRLEELLENMLPESISKRLRTEGKTFADGYASATVLFADLVGFTPMAADMSPMELVQLLNKLFTTFDQFTEEFGLEKIKTIGDAYMAAAGLPVPREDHAHAAVDLALRIRAEISQYAALNVRIGVNSGEVVAGVIGKKRFIYDLWGDTVNIASRMESHGVVGEIQISESTYQYVKGQFDCELRGKIEVKGRGEMSVYLVKGRIT